MSLRSVRSKVDQASLACFTQDVSVDSLLPWKRHARNLCYVNSPSSLGGIINIWLNEPACIVSHLKSPWESKITRPEGKWEEGRLWSCLNIKPQNISCLEQNALSVCSTGITWTLWKGVDLCFCPLLLSPFLLIFLPFFFISASITFEMHQKKFLIRFYVC